jgi:uncharacterized membrane protein YbhN (UPF0104 family)
MLDPLKPRISFYNLFSTTAVGYAVSCLTPGRIGEVARPVLLARREGILVPRVIATVAIERVLDVAAIVALAAAAALSAPAWWEGERATQVTVPWLGRTDLGEVIAWFGLAGLATCLGLLLLLRALVMENSRFMALVARRRSGAGRFARMWEVVSHVAEGGAFLRSPRRALGVGLQSVLIWVVIAAASWVGLLAARVQIPFPGAFLLVALSAVGISVPTPGGVGTVHVAFQRGLIDLFHVEPNLASAATFLYHPITIYIPPIVFGLCFAWRDGLNAAKLRALPTAAEPQPQTQTATPEGGRHD